MTQRNHHVAIHVKMFPHEDTGLYVIKYRPHYSKEWKVFGNPLKKGAALQMLNKRNRHYSRETKALREHFTRNFVYWKWAS